MAILLQSGDKRVRWSVIGGVIGFAVFLVASTYYLFFSATPFVDTFFKTDRERVSKISGINIDPAGVSKIIKYPNDKAILKNRVPKPSLASPGKANPFLLQQ